MGQLQVRPTTYENRSVLYGDVEQLISPGFLTCHVRLGTVRLVLRTLGGGDASVLQARVAGGVTSGGVMEWWRWTLASATLAVNGYLVQGRGQEWVADFLAGCPDIVVEALFDVFLRNLIGRQDQARHASYVYVYERASRDLWRSFGARPWEVGEVPGSRRAAGNPVQKWWIAFNEVEDVREDYARHWRGYKLVTSATSPKGVKKINDSDDRAEQSEELWRADVLSRYFWYRAGVLDLDTYVKGMERDSFGGNYRLRTKSVEELDQDYQKWVRGEEDEHDKIVREYKTRTLAELDRRRHKVSEAAVRAAAEFADYNGPDMRNPKTVDQLGPVVRTSTWAPDAERITRVSRAPRPAGQDPGENLAVDDDFGGADLRNPKTADQLGPASRPSTWAADVERVTPSGRGLR